MDHRVSIIIIGRNEERSIGKCIEAALASAEQIGGAEMIYVDSHSTDKTVTVVEGYGVRVLELHPALRRCPSAGRYIGSMYARGKFVLFLDADTLIYPDFLPAALDHFEADPKLGGLNGYIEDFSEAGVQLFEIEERYDDVTEVKWLRGPCCFYRRRALAEAGSFNPELATEEEAELGLRLVQKDWKLKVIPLRMACHTRCFHPHSFESILSTFLRDIRSGRLGEITRTIAYAARAGNGLAFCWLRLNTTILFGVWALAILISCFLPGIVLKEVAIGSLILLGGLAIWARKRSLYQTLVFLPSKVICLIDILWGVGKIPMTKTPMPSLDNVHQSLSTK